MRRRRLNAITQSKSIATRFANSGPVLPFPASIPGCQLWLDAADVNGTGTNPSNGTAITSWKDKSGLGKHATNVGSPVLASTGVNSKPGILLNGTSMGFRGDLANTETVSTTFVVATLTTTTGLDARLVSLAGSSGDDYGNNTSVVPFLKPGSLNVAGFRNTIYRSLKSVPGYSTPFYGSSTFDGANNTVHINGVAGSPETSIGSFAIAKYGIGIQANNNAHYWKGYVSEVLIYNSALSTENRQAVESYLATKWSI